MKNVEKYADLLKVLYEDNHVLVVVKPAGIPSQADKTGDLDMLSICKAYIKKKYNKPGEVYLGLVHRLDRMVGGVMIFARTSKAASRLSEYIRQHNFKKKYIAVVNGDIGKSGQFRDFLVKNEKLNKSMTAQNNERGAKEAVLEYTYVKSFEYNSKKYSLVDINLKTGRHHQIRVQFANASFPLYGDIKYGEKVNKVGQNLALWSYYLSIFHPTKDEIIEIKCMPNEVEINEMYVENKIWRNI